MRTMLFSLLFISSFLVHAAVADPLIDAVRQEAAALSPLDVAVTRTKFDNSGSTRHEKARFDPRQAEAERWQLLEHNHQSPSEKYAQRYEDDDDRPAPDSYARIDNYLSGDVTRISTDAFEAVYRIERLGPGSIILKGEDISDKISGEAVIDISGGQPFVREVRLKVAEDFKPHWLARITDGSGIVRFARLPNGVPVITRQSLNVQGKKPFGRINYETDMLYEDHVYVGDDKKRADLRLGAVER